MVKLRLRCLAVGSAAVLALVGVGASGAAALDVGVTVPGVGGAGAPVPGADVTVPELITPPVTVPALPPLPSVTAPAPVPILPAPSLPSAPSTPAVPAVPAPAVPSSPETQPASAGATAPAPAPVASSGGPSPTANGAGASASRTAAPAQHDGGVAGAPSPTRQRAGSLEQAVTELRQCLDRLSTREREVLSLRAGIGPRAPLSRSQVARRLDLGLTQTGRIERRGLRRLDLLAGTNACGGPAGRSAALPANAAAHADAVAGGLSAATTGLRPRFGVGGVVAHGGSSDSGEDANGRSGLGLPPPIGSGGEATLLVALGLFVALALLVRRELQRR